MNLEKKLSIRYYISDEHYDFIRKTIENLPISANSKERGFLEISGDNNNIQITSNVPIYYKGLGELGKYGYSIDFDCCKDSNFDLVCQVIKKDDTTIKIH